jgi:PKD repeat protein
LTVSNPAGSDVETKVDYITAASPPASSSNWWATNWWIPVVGGVTVVGIAILILRRMRR